MQDVSVETPQGSTYEGKRFDGKVHAYVVDEPIPVYTKVYILIRKRKL